MRRRVGRWLRLLALRIDPPTGTTWTWASGDSMGTSGNAEARVTYTGGDFQ